MYINNNIKNIIGKYTGIYFKITINNKCHTCADLSKIDDIIEYHLIELYPYHYERDDYVSIFEQYRAPCCMYKFWNIDDKKYLNGIDYNINIVYVKGNGDYSEYESSHTFYIKGINHLI